jgi:RNA polymerase sigma factor (TIGR02999 family)
VEQTTISSLILAAEGGERAATEALFTALYDELHRMARRQVALNSPGVGIGATSLLHEAYLDIAQRERAKFPDRARFMAYAARVMRSLIIDHARSRRAQKRGGQFQFTDLDTEASDAPGEDLELSRLGEALDELGADEPALAEVVDLKFFCGFSFAEIAAMRGITERTVQRHWDKARIYLRRALRSDPLA